MKKVWTSFLAGLLLLLTLTLAACGGEVTIDHDRFRQVASAPIFGNAVAINDEACSRSYVLVYISVTNEMKNKVSVRNGDYVLSYNGQEIASEGYLQNIAFQSGSDGKDHRLYTTASETIIKRQTKKLGVLFYCDATAKDELKLYFGDHEIAL